MQQPLALPPPSTQVQVVLHISIVMQCSLGRKNLVSNDDTDVHMSYVMVPDHSVVDSAFL